jgi:hypothetical protein
MGCDADAHLAGLVRQNSQEGRRKKRKGKDHADPASLFRQARAREGDTWEEHVATPARGEFPFSFGSLESEAVVVARRRGRGAVFVDSFGGAQIDPILGLPLNYCFKGSYPCRGARMHMERATQAAHSSFHPSICILYTVYISLCIFLLHKSQCWSSRTNQVYSQELHKLCVVVLIACFFFSIFQFIDG